MGILSEAIVNAAKRTQGYAERLLVGITPAQFARFPRFATTPPTVIKTNHAAFVYGHLALYPARVVVIMGGDAAPFAAPPSYEPVLKAGVDCVDDERGATYAPMSEIVSVYTKGYASVIEYVAKAKDELLGQVPTDERARQNFPTIGAATNFLLNNHVMMHLGQVSAWRRCMGLPPA